MRLIDSVPLRCAGKLPFSGAPHDDRGLPDMHLALYDDVVVFDHATKLAYVISWVHVDDYASVEQAGSLVACCLAAYNDDRKVFSDRLVDTGVRFALKPCQGCPSSACLACLQSTVQGERLLHSQHTGDDLAPLPRLGMIDCVLSACQM